MRGDLNFIHNPSRIGTQCWVISFECRVTNRTAAERVGTLPISLANDRLQHLSIDEHWHE